jgi:copper chaperone CopZ
MTSFTVLDMTCGGCAQRIGRALAEAGLPDELHVKIDVASRQVHVSAPPSSDAAELVRAAIRHAGYTPQLAISTVAAPTTRGCCCAARQDPTIDPHQHASGKNPSCCN